MALDIHRWLERDPDPSTREELRSLIESQESEKIRDRFKSRLAFGTAGLRGKVGAGPNRINQLVVLETTLGLGLYLNDSVKNAKLRGVLVGYDARPDSERFAKSSAEVLLALGFNVFLSSEMGPTPLVAFGVKHLGAAAGIVVTASHNPPEYNGYKVYWGNGAQITTPHDSGIASAIERATRMEIPQDNLEQHKNLTWLDSNFTRTYLSSLSKISLPDQRVDTKKSISVAYTAMHGVGGEMISAIATLVGLDLFYPVPEQFCPDGAFPTVPFPNPEEIGAMDRVIALAKTKDADLACANDPDADRFAVAAKIDTGEYRILTGDQVGILLGNYLMSLRPKSWVGSTIVSCSLLEKLASQHGSSYYKTLTGFKWLTNMAMSYQTSDRPFLFAYEEALGYAITDLVWDKDGLSSFLVFVLLAENLKKRNLSVWDQLLAIYRQHGFYATAQKNLVINQDSGSVSDGLRRSPPSVIAGRVVVSVEDFLTLKATNQRGEVQMLDYPSSDVLIYYLEDSSRVIVRPSGTEPKLKCYYEICYKLTEGLSFLQAQKKADKILSLLVSEHQNSIITSI